MSQYALLTHQGPYLDLPLPCAITAALRLNQGRRRICLTRCALFFALLRCTAMNFV